MASGVGVNDACVSAFDDLKMKHKLRYVMYRISDDNTEIVVDKTGKPNATFEDFSKELVPDICRYAIYDLTYDDGGVEKNKIVLLAWIPVTAKMKDKMVYTSSKDALKKTLFGIATEVQFADQKDLTEENVITVVKTKKG